MAPRLKCASICLLTALLVCGLIQSAGAQQQLAAVQGTIADETKAVVPGVTVTVRNLETGAGRSTSSNSVGVYRIAGLPPGRYELIAELEGFKKAVQTDLVLSVGAVVGRNLQLTHGGITETVDVTAVAPDIQTEKADVSAVVENQKIIDLPNLARNVFQVAQLQPGINTMDPSNTADFANSEYGAGLQASGTRDSGTSVMMDGAGLNSGPWSGTVMLVPNVDSVQEIEVIANNPSAEYGRNAGAAVSIITKGGTNEWHGSLYDFYRNEGLNSRNAFEDPNSVKPDYLRNDFGGSIGGPIKKDTTFFFLSYEGVRQNTSNGSSRTVETQQFVDFVTRTRPNSIAAQLLKQYPPIAYPTTGLKDLGSPAPGANKIGPADGIPDVGTISVVNKSTHDGDQINARLDHNFGGGKDFARAVFYRTTVGGSSTPIRAAFDNPMPVNMETLNLAETHVVSQSTLNEFSFGYLRMHGEAGDATPGVPTISVGSGVPGFGIAFWQPITYTQNVFEFRDVLTVNRGHHAIRAGAEYKYTKDYSLLHHWERPNYSFRNILDFADDEAWSEDRAVDPANGLSTTAPGDYRTSEASLFLQDNWKVRPNLTLNLGLRWEVFGSPSKAEQPFNGIVLGSGNTRQEQMRDARITTVDSLYATDWNNVGPRLGFAWDPQSNSKLVIRGGFGVSYNRLGNTIWTDERLNPPQFAHARTTRDTPTIPIVYSLGPDYPANPALGAGVDEHGGIKGARVDLRIIDPEAKTPSTYNWFFGVQRDLGGRFVLDVNYIGTSSHNWMSWDGPGGESYNRFAGDLADGSFDGLNSSFGWMGLAESRIDSRYNGLTVQLQRRHHRGFSFQAAYTLGKVTDTAGSSIEVTRPDLEEGPADFDVRHRATMNFLWEIPSPTGNSALKHILGGWQLNGTGIYQTGLPFSVVDCNLDSNLDGNYCDRPNTPAFGSSLSGLSNDDYLNGIFTASDFPAPGAGQLVGTLGRNTFRGPRYLSADLSLFKNITVPWFGSKDAKLQLRAEAFNVFNVKNLYNVHSDLSDPAFGTATDARTARVIQLGAKLIF